jgi:FlaA1/EpsC-like NDP-sugar epimerase
MIRSELDRFISENVINREVSLFQEDINARKADLTSACNGKSFLIIGGAGTIGSNYIKAILPYKPKHITVIDYSENGLTELVRDLRSTNVLPVPDEFITYAFDFGLPLLEKVMQQKHFDVIACFAAHKHVRSEKDVIAVEAMFQNNVFNTDKLLKLAQMHHPEHVFAVSTDKASGPVNVMGGTKKLMENLILAYSPYINVTTARFANVAFSNGSLLNGFINRLDHRQPITAPNDVKRYFVSPAESGQICMISSLLGQSTDIFFPKLAEENTRTFSCIATSFLKQMGLEPDVCISEEEAKSKAFTRKESDTSYPVYYFPSDTTGEKSLEEFFGPLERKDLETFVSMGVIKDLTVTSLSAMANQLSDFRNLFRQPDLQKHQIVTLMKKYIPDFDHQETGKYLDSKM